VPRPHTAQDDSVLTLEDASTPRRATAPAADSDSASDSDEASSSRGGGGGPDDGSPIPIRALIDDNPTSAGARAISQRQRHVFGGRLASVVSTDVQMVPGGNILAVVLGTLSSQPQQLPHEPGACPRPRPRPRQDVTFLHTFILERRGEDGGAGGFGSGGGGGGGEEEEHEEMEMGPLSEYVIVNEVFRRLDPVDRMGGGEAATTAATLVLQAALSPPATPPRPTSFFGGGRGGGGVVGVGSSLLRRASSLPAARAAAGLEGSVAATPRKEKAAPLNDPGEDSSDVDEEWLDDAPSVTPSPAAPPPLSPNPFLNDELSAVTPVRPPRLNVEVQGAHNHYHLGVGGGGGGGGGELMSPSATLLPLPSPTLLQQRQRPATSSSLMGSGETRLQRVERRYSHEHEDAGTRRNLAFDASPFLDRGKELRGRSERGGAAGGDARGGGGKKPPSSRHRRRVFSSATSSPAMSAGGASHHASPLQDGGGALGGEDSPAAKRGLSRSFYDNALWEGARGAEGGGGGGSGSRGGSPRGGAGHNTMNIIGGGSVHTISERSDEGSKAGSASASASVSVCVSEGEHHVGELGGGGAGGRGGGGGTGTGHSGLDGYSAYEESEDGGGSVRGFSVAEGEPVEWGHRGGDHHHHHRRRSPSPGVGRAASPSYSSRGGASPLHGGRRHRRHHRSSGGGGLDDFSYPGGSAHPGAYGGSRHNHQRYGRSYARYAGMGMGISRGGSYSASVSVAASPTGSRPGSRSAAGASVTAAERERRNVSGGGGGGGRFSSGGGVGRTRGGGGAAAAGVEHVKLRRSAESAPPTPSAGATRAREFGNVRPHHPRGSRASNGGGGGAFASGSHNAYTQQQQQQQPQRRRASSPPQQQQQQQQPGELKSVVSTLSVLAASVHFTAAAVVFTVLVMAIHANRRSTDALTLQLDRMDTVVASGRVPANIHGGGGGFGLSGGARSAADFAGAPSPGMPPLVQPHSRFARATSAADHALEREEGGAVDVGGFLRPPPTAVGGGGVGDVRAAPRIVVYAASSGATVPAGD
jgi:hypothetical protein